MSDVAAIPQSLSAIDFLRTRSLTNVVQAEIERMIVEGELQPNQRVNENALAQKLGVSRGPIREACNALAAMGLLEIIPNRGFFVRSLSEAETYEVAIARAGVFAYICMIFAERITDAEVKELRTLVNRMDKAASSSDVSAYYPMNVAFHETILRLCGNQRLAQVYRGLVRDLHIHLYGAHVYRALIGASTLAISNAEHRAIVDALAARDPMRAFEAAHAHLRNSLERNRKTTEAKLPKTVKSRPRASRRKS